MLLQSLGWNDRWSATFAPYRDAGLVPGRVVRVDRDRVLVTADGAEVVARGRELPAVGDWVALDGDAVAAVLPRSSALVRRDPGKPVAQVIAANVDMVFVVAPVDPEANLRRIERTMAMAWESGAVPAVVLTKPDRCPDLDDQLSAVRAVALGVDVFVVNGLTGEGVDDLRGDTTAVFVGPSGAGKSTVTNWLLGGSAPALPTADVRKGDRKGRHTTTARHLVALPGGGVVIDTPGMRALATWDVSEGAAAVFVDIDELAEGCRFRDCRHDAEPGCAVVGVVDADRLRNWRHLARPVDRAEAKRRAKVMGRAYREIVHGGIRGAPPRR